MLLADHIRFTSDAFFGRAAAVLDPEPRREANERMGDEHLNPDVTPDGLDFRDAAVLVPVVARSPEASILLTLRTPHLAKHAGQIAFPGGKIEASDAGPAAAALREAEEEIGLSPSLVQPIGYLPAYLTRTGFRITPVVARVEPAHSLIINPDEVADAFEVPLSFLMTPANHRQGSRVFMDKPRYFYEMPYQDRYIWGITAGIIRGLYQRLYG